jgi:hypothetical protein
MPLSSSRMARTLATSAPVFAPLVLVLSPLALFLREHALKPLLMGHSPLDTLKAVGLRLALE